MCLLRNEEKFYVMKLTLFLKKKKKKKNVIPRTSYTESRNLKKIPTGVDIRGWKVDFNAHLEIKHNFIFLKKDKMSMYIMLPILNLW